MLNRLKNKLYNLLRWSEKYAKTDMLYLFRSGFWLTLGQITATGAAFILSIAFANLLPKENYGTYRYILSLFNIFIIFSLSGTNTSIIQAIARGFEGSFWKIFKAKVSWSLLGSLVSVCIASYYWLQNNHLISIALVIIAIFLPFFESSSLYQSLLQGRKNFRQGTIFSNFTSLISLLIMLTTLWFTDNILIILTSYLAGQISCQLFFTYLTIKKQPLNNQREDQALKFGVHLSVMEILKIIAGQVDKILIFHYLGAGQLALYAFIVAPVSQSKSFILNIKSLALPKLSQISNENVTEHFPEKIKRLEIVVAALMIIYIVMSPWLFKIFFPNYIAAVPYSQVYALSLLFLPRSLLSTLMIAKIKQKELYSIRLIAPIWRIVVLFLMLRYFGLWGMIWGTIISEFGQFFLYNYFYHRAFKKPTTNLVA